VHSYEAFKTHLAIALQHPNAEAFALQAWQLEYEGRYPEAFDMIGRATALSPGDANNHIVRARILNAVGRAPEAEQEVRVAMRLDPGFSPAMLRVLAISLFHQKRYTEAIDVIVRLEAQSAVDLDDYRLLVSAAGHLGRLDEAKRAAAEYERLRRPALFDSLSVEDTAYFWAGDAFNYSQPYIDDLLEGLRKAGIPEGAGSDLPLARYKALMTRTLGEYDVAGAVKVDVPTAKALHERGAKFVDLRSRLEFSAGHIPGAVGLSLTEQLSREALAAVVPTDEEVVFYCHGKYCPTSPYGTAKAIAWGWRHVYYFAGGFPAWQDAGLQVEGGNT
jgi:rhodanese-related sulfurtransferase